MYYLCSIRFSSLTFSQLSILLPNNKQIIFHSFTILNVAAGRIGLCEQYFLFWLALVLLHTFYTYTFTQHWWRKRVCVLCKRQCILRKIFPAKIFRGREEKLNSNGGKVPLILTFGKFINIGISFAFHHRSSKLCEEIRITIIIKIKKLNISHIPNLCSPSSFYTNVTCYNAP